ncbi:MAG: type II toxin-antitoxin system VapC family toxin [Opitutales bacterium]
MGSAPRITYVLDTHVLLWFRIKPDELGPKTLRLLKKPETAIVISIVTALEVALLVHKGRISLPQPVDTWFEVSLTLFQTKAYPLTPQIISDAYTLPDPFYADPADRLLVATARVEELTLITADQRILDYPAVPAWNGRT